jgi:hypothetical protein
MGADSFSLHSSKGAVSNPVWGRVRYKILTQKKENRSYEI